MLYSRNFVNFDEKLFMLRARGDEKNSRCARGHLTVHADISMCTRTSQGARGLLDVHAAEAIFEAFARGYSRMHADSACMIYHALGRSSADLSSFPDCKRGMRVKGPSNNYVTLIIAFF